MKMIILAAGQGTRLRPFTNDKPKCMVEYRQKPIIDYILDVAKACKIKDIALINGYKKEVLEKYLEEKNLSFYTNINFDKTNMVSTLFCAEEFMDDDIIISYSDIIYSKEILQKLINSDSDFSVVVDKDWEQLWSLRMENPLDDAESMIIEDGKIVELGKKVSSYKDIQGQYIGLIKISKNIIKEFISFYNSLDRNKNYDNKDFDNMYMTSLIQKVIDNFQDVIPVYINGGWIEIDSTEDISQYLKYDIKV